MKAALLALLLTAAPADGNGLFALYAQGDESHATPFGTIQQFQYAAFRRN